MVYMFLSLVLLLLLPSAAPISAETIVSETVNLTVKGEPRSFIASDCEHVDCGGSQSTVANNISVDEKEDKVKRAEEEEEGTPKTDGSSSATPASNPVADLEYPPKALVHQWLHRQMNPTWERPPYAPPSKKSDPQRSSQSDDKHGRSSISSNSPLPGDNERPSEGPEEESQGPHTEETENDQAWMKEYWPRRRLYLSRAEKYEADPKAPAPKSLPKDPIIFTFYQAAPHGTSAVLNITRAFEGKGVIEDVQRSIAPKSVIHLHYIFSPSLVYMSCYPHQAVFERGPESVSDKSFRSNWDDMMKASAGKLRYTVNDVDHNVYEGDLRLEFLRQRLLTALFKHYAELRYTDRDPTTWPFSFDWSIMTRNEAEALRTLVASLGKAFDEISVSIGNSLSIAWLLMEGKLSAADQLVSFQFATIIHDNFSYWERFTKVCMWMLKEAIEGTETSFATPRKQDYRYIGAKDRPKKADRKRKADRSPRPEN